MFEYEVVPVALTRGAGAAAASGEWETVRNALNDHGRQGYRVVAVTDGTEGRAIIMERRPDRGESAAEAVAITEAAEAITLEAAEPDATR